jgi:photosystem II stability/assembly factor-like uncharacterized protein
MRRILLALAVIAAGAPWVRAADPRHFDDAALHAVQFVDSKEGWAAGDEGVVWHTIDGGATWERQPTGVRASLRSLHFLDPFHGWVAGREELPHDGGSVGVLLYTADGGCTWRRLLMNAVPGLNHIRFADKGMGYALGDGGGMYPTGVFKTIDGGRTWEPLKGALSPGWLFGDFKDARSGALAGAWGRVGTIAADGLGTAKVDDLGVRSLRALQLRDGRGLAVGQGGLLLTSSSGGARWGFADLKLAPEVLSSWDFHAVHWVGDHIWVVGRPGSVVLHSDNRGAGWRILKTKQPLPLNGVYFFDQKRGWAVGELGSILGTTDGGKTWAVQRRGGQRAGVMFVHARPMDLPVETLAQLGFEEGHLAACVRATAPDPRSAAPARASDPHRFAAGVRRAGGAAGELLWQFPVPRHLAEADRDGLLRHWGQLHGGPAQKQLVRQLVLALRTWRPDVVVTDHPDVRVTGSAAAALLAEALHEAFRLAADDKAFSEQFEHLGLQPWRVAKLYSVWDRSEGAHVVVEANKDLPQLDTSAREFAEPAADLLSDGPRSLPGERCYRLLDSTVEGAAGLRHLMAGIPVGAVGVARRALPPAAELRPEVVKANRRQRNLRAIAARPVPGIAEAEKLLPLVAAALAGLPEDQGVSSLLAVAGSYARRGQWQLAREAYLLLVDRYPAHPRAVEAYRWLIRLGTSGEARRRQELEHYAAFVRTKGEKGAKADEPIRRVGVREAASGAYEVEGPDTKTRPVVTLAGSVEQMVMTRRDPGVFRDSCKESLELGKKLRAFGPLFRDDPAMQFCLQAARRRLGEFKEAQDYYGWLKMGQADGPWREAALSELWVAERKGQPPRPATACRQTSTKPRLDGNFDDPCWQGLQPLTLRNAAEDTTKEYATEARFAYDREFLYIALRCKHPPGQRVEPVQRRQRDEDLRPHDRVSILLDLDRDYSTYYHLQVDQRGCVCEDCWGDRSWNPRWFVAVRSADDAWQIEAAIPLAELTGEVITHGTVWACNVVRVLPGRGVQGWSLPAGAEPRPEGMGLLFFIPERPPEPRPVPPTR